MAKLLSWLKATTVKAIDPNRELRLASTTAHVWEEIVRQRARFDYRETLASLGVDIEDNVMIAERVFAHALERAWKDGEVSQQERGSLDTIGRLLHLEPKRVRELQIQAGYPYFEALLTSAVADGKVDASEAQSLAAVAASLGTTTRELVYSYFKDTGEAVLRNLSANSLGCAASGPREWQRLCITAAGLGFTEAELQEYVRPQAEVYVEQVLADVKADQHISADERKGLTWLLRTFNLPVPFQHYVHAELDAVQLREDVRHGNLPVVPATNVELRAGELAHFQCPATFVQVKQSKSGPREVRHDGVVTITDCRLIFSSITRSVDLNHRSVVGLNAFQSGVEVRASGSGAGFYVLSVADPVLGAAVYQVAVSKANQTIVQRAQGANTRHIPRDVRQRIWQAYGGRCADCGSTQYLEFDHIVPVAKGGSNGDSNVQLLCRGCNGKKSDRI